MKLDLCVPMGWMFTLTGLLLTLFGLATKDNAAIYAKSLGTNANLWWGLVLLAFGLSMFLFGRRAAQRLENTPPKPKRAVRRGH